MAKIDLPNSTDKIREVQSYFVVALNALLVILYYYKFSNYAL